MKWNFFIEEYQSHIKIEAVSPKGEKINRVIPSNGTIKLKIEPDPSYRPYHENLKCSKTIKIDPSCPNFDLVRKMNCSITHYRSRISTISNGIIKFANDIVFDLNKPLELMIFENTMIFGIKNILDLNIGESPSNINIYIKHCHLFKKAILDAENVIAANLITTNGFRHICKFNQSDKSIPLFHSCDEYEIFERIDASGNILSSISTKEIEHLLKSIKLTQRPTCVSFVNSYKNPIHEQQVLKIAKNLGIHDLQISSNICNVKNYTIRSITSMINSYLSFYLKDYFEQLINFLGKKSKLFFITNNGKIVQYKDLLPKDLLFTDLNIKYLEIQNELNDSIFFEEIDNEFHIFYSHKTSDIGYINNQPISTKIRQTYKVGKWNNRSLCKIINFMIKNGFTNIKTTNPSNEHIVELIRKELSKSSKDLEIVVYNALETLGHNASISIYTNEKFVYHETNCRFLLSRQMICPNENTTIHERHYTKHIVPLMYGDTKYYIASTKFHPIKPISHKEIKHQERITQEINFKINKNTSFANFALPTVQRSSYILLNDFSKIDLQIDSNKFDFSKSYNLQNYKTTKDLIESAILFAMYKIQPTTKMYHLPTIVIPDDMITNNPTKEGIFETPQKIVNLICEIFDVPKSPMTNLVSFSNKTYEFTDFIPNGIKKTQNYYPNFNNMINEQSVDPEIIEDNYPILIKRIEMTEYKFPGLRKEYSFLHDASGFIISHNGMHVLIHKGKHKILSPNCQFEISNGDSLIIETSAGGINN